MSKAGIFLGEPLNFKGIFKIYPPTVKEVVTNPSFNFASTLFTLTQEDLDEEFLKDLGPMDERPNIPNPFEYMLINAYNSSAFRIKVEDSFKLFLHEQVTLFPDIKTIVIGELTKELLNTKKASDFRLLKEEDYFLFQNYIRESLGQEPLESPEDLSKLHPRVREMKMKARLRDRVKAKQDAKNAPKLEVLLASLCCMGAGLNPLNIGEISYASIQPIISANTKKERYEVNNMSLIMGADPKKVKQEYWIRNSED